VAWSLGSLRRWEEERHRITSSKMICMPTHMCNNVLNYRLMRTICVTTYYCNGTIRIYYYSTPTTTTLATYAWNICKTCCNIRLQLLLLLLYYTCNYYSYVSNTTTTSTPMRFIKKH
jgi:hypothetical protein